MAERLDVSFIVPMQTLRINTSSKICITPKTIIIHYIAGSYYAYNKHMLFTVLVLSSYYQILYQIWYARNFDLFVLIIRAKALNNSDKMCQIRITLHIFDTQFTIQKFTNLRIM